MDKASEKRLKRRIAKMVHEHPSLVMDALLNHPFWPQGVSSGNSYQRYGDDDNSFVRVVFSSDGDAWPDVYHLEQESDPKHPISTPRYRTYFGGGQSVRTRQALCILARAIGMDNEARPQRRPR